MKLDVFIVKHYNIPEELISNFKKDTKAEERSAYQLFYYLDDLDDCINLENLLEYEEIEEVIIDNNDKIKLLNDD